MKLSQDPPEIYPRLKESFGVDWDKGVIVAYGNTIHCKLWPMSEDLIEHEKVHLFRQEEVGLEKWWEEYISDPIFRLQEEIAAYEIQAEVLREICKNRDERYMRHSKMWRDMSTMYGGMCTLAEAKKLIPWIPSKKN